MGLNDQIVLFILGQVITGAAIWGAIRSDIRNMMTRMNDIKGTADHAHRRIDDLMTDGYVKYRKYAEGNSK